eukprot:m.17219 g.17219  ORF g.17219 m.17219 type:complete len:249 (+) comp27388_c0_seq2:148-894(+)
MLRGKAALITGAASGIGKSIASALMQRSCNVAVVDFNRENGKDAAAQLNASAVDCRAVFIECDVTETEKFRLAFQETLSKFGSLDIVCNNAGIISEYPSDWKLTLDINLKAVIEGTYLAFEHMEKSKGGVVINIASMAGLLPLPSSPVYVASKHGVLGFTKSIRDDASKRGIRVNALCPTMVRTELLERGMRESEEFRKYVESLGIVEMKTVIDGVLQLVEDETKNGAIMRVTRQKGIDYEKYRGAKL